MAEIGLPTHPVRTEFEESVSAVLQCGGAYVERQITEREDEAILELDVVLTYLSREGSEVSIVEAKSGEWGYGDLFKLAGWMRYLDVADALFVSRAEARNRQLTDRVASKLGIKLALAGSHEEAVRVLCNPAEEPALLDVEIDLWRYAYWLERCLVQRLSDLRRAGSRQGPIRVWDVHKGLQENQFAQDMLGRTVGLYQAFSEYSHIAARWGAEERGLDFDGDHSRIPTDLFRDVYYRGVATPHDLDLATWVEHRMRLAILKNLVEYELLRRSRGDDAFNRVVFTIMGREFRLVDTLPSSFRNALEILREHVYFHRYPVFWQWFLWVAGGFLLNDHMDEEHEWLAMVSGIPSTEVPKALEVYDILYPTENGWFKNLGPGSALTVLAVMPVPYCGIGSNLRRLRYSNDESYDGMSVTGSYTISDLTKWSSNLVAYLARCR